MEGKRVVEEGAFWRVGDGQLIDVWNDSWVKGPEGFKLSGPEGIIPTPLKVATLIDQEKREWRNDMIDEIFKEVDAGAIKRIRLNRDRIQDKLIWRQTTNGIFTVRSAYQMVMRVLGKEVHLLNQRNQWWNTIWYAKIMPKIKYFVWYLINGFIPVGSELKKKGIQMNYDCPVCGEQEKSMFHAFFACELSCTVWRY